MIYLVVEYQVMNYTLMSYLHEAKSTPIAAFESIDDAYDFIDELDSDESYGIIMSIPFKSKG